MFERERCQICGAQLLTNIYVGCTCQKIYENVKWNVLLSHSYSLEKHKIESNFYMKHFLKLDTKFRSNFKINFYDSMCSQWNSCQKISKKQLDIVKNFVWEKHDYQMLERQVKVLIDNLIGSMEEQYQYEIMERARSIFLLKKKNKESAKKA